MSDVDKRRTYKACASMYLKMSIYIQVCVLCLYHICMRAHTFVYIAQPLRSLEMQFPIGNNKNNADSEVRRVCAHATSRLEPVPLPLHNRHCRQGVRARVRCGRLLPPPKLPKCIKQ